MDFLHKTPLSSKILIQYERSQSLLLFEFVIIFVRTLAEKFRSQLLGSQNGYNCFQVRLYIQLFGGELSSGGGKELSQLKTKQVELIFLLTAYKQRKSVACKVSYKQITHNQLTTVLMDNQWLALHCKYLLLGSCSIRGCLFIT